MANVDLPLPVRPRTAVVEPPGIRRERLDRAGSRWGLYRMVTSSKVMSVPNFGHDAGGSTVPGVSCSMWSSSSTLSTDTKSIWSWPYCLHNEWVDSTKLFAAISTKAANPGETFVYSARTVRQNVDKADRLSKR